MNRRIRIILLAISLLLVIGTLGWLTHVLLVQAEETGHSEQRIRVEALAHEAKLEMDRLLTSFITFEQARGYFEYQPVYAYKRPYDLRMGAPGPRRSNPWFQSRRLPAGLRYSLHSDFPCRARNRPRSSPGACRAAE